MLNKMIDEVNPPQAAQMLQENENAVMVDVRSSMEFAYVGHVPGSVFVPLKEPPGWEDDPAFIGKLEHVLQQQYPEKDPRDLTLLFLCRSGARSMTAAQMLYSVGYEKVFNVAEGFEGDKDEHHHRSSINGWRFHGLPWVQS